MAASLTPPAELLVQRAGCAWNDRPTHFYPCRATMLRAIRPPMALRPAAYYRSVRSRRNARVKTLITPYPHIDQCRSWITSTDTFEYSFRTFTPSSRPLHSNSIVVIVVIVVVLQHITQPKVASFRHYLRSNNHAIDSINSFTYFLLASICGIINQNPCGKPGYTFIFVGIPYSVRNTFS